MDFAKILSKIDSIQSTKQLNESAKPDFLDLDKDGNRKESMKKAAADKKKKDVAEAAKGTPHKVRYRYDDPSGKGIASGHITLYAPDKAAAERYAVSDLTKQGKKNVRVQSVTPQKQDVKEDTVNEVSAPGQEDWIKKNKQRFIDQYGKKKGMEVLYATAWKRSKKVDEARQLEECYGQAMQNMSNQMDDRSGMSVSSSMDTRTGSKTLTVSAEGDAADQLAQMLKLSGLVVGTVGSQDVELEEYANEPATQVQGIETQLQQGNDLNRPKKMTPHGYQNGDNPLAMDVREQEELSALSQALSEELEGIKVDKSKVPAYKRKQRGGDWKTTQQDLQRERERNISGAEGLAALKKKQGMSEAAKPDFLDLDKDGNRKESMKKAAADKKKKGVAEGFENTPSMIARLFSDNKQLFDMATQGNITPQLKKLVSIWGASSPWGENTDTRDTEWIDGTIQHLLQNYYPSWKSKQGVAEAMPMTSLTSRYVDDPKNPAFATKQPTGKDPLDSLPGIVALRKTDPKRAFRALQDYGFRNPNDPVIDAASKIGNKVSQDLLQKKGITDPRPWDTTDEMLALIQKSIFDYIEKNLSKEGVAEGSLNEISPDLLRRAATVAADKEDKLRKSRYQNHADYQLAVQKGENPDFDQAALRNKDLHAKRLRALDQERKFKNAADLKSGNLKNHDLTYAQQRAKELQKATLGRFKAGDYHKKASEIDQNSPWYNRPVWFSDTKEGVAEGYKNTYNVGDRVDSPLGTGTIVAVSKNVNVDGRVKVKLDDPSKAGEDGKHKDSFVLTTTQLKHISE